MSTGMVICSICGKEVHQWGDREVSRGWVHCETREPICGSAIYPKARADVKGKACEADGRMPEK